MSRLGIAGAASMLALAGCMTAPRAAPTVAPEAALATEPATSPATSPALATATATEPQADKYGPGTGESLVSLGLQLSSSKAGGSTSKSIAAQIGGGYFLTEEHEVGGHILWNYINPDEGSSAAIFFLAPYYNYNYRANPRLWYYGGPHLGLSHVAAGGSSSNSLAAGLHAGARYWLSPTTSVYVEPRYTHYRQFGSNTDDLTLLIGLSVTF